ncbi:MAG: DUF2946 family protein, partial [Alphaproteobacteria bacterium]|nr:DUF2946 family protein [Alphaproteobacteria bacterium]
MGIGRMGAGRWRGVAGWLALVAFLVNALIPAGYMLAPDVAGGTSVMLCTSAGMVEVSLDLPSREGDRAPEPSSPRPQADGAACLFAVATAALLP